MTSELLQTSTIRMIKNVFGSLDNLSMSFQLRGMGDIQMTQTAFGKFSYFFPVVFPPFIILSDKP